MSSAPPDLKPFTLFAEFGEEDFDAVSELLERRKIAGGRRLFREGSEANGLVLITEGRVEISSSRTERTAVLGPGSALGATSLIVVGPRELVAKTLEPCELWTFQRESFRRLIDDYPRTACRLCEAIVAELVGNVRDGLDGFTNGDG